MLIELCSHGGYCSNGLTVDDLVDDLTADEITEMVLRGEGLDPVMGSGEGRGTKWDAWSRTGCSTPADGVPSQDFRSDSDDNRCPTVRLRCSDASHKSEVAQRDIIRAQHRLDRPACYAADSVC